MNIDQAGYTYIDTDHGPYRLSRKGEILQQYMRGGSPSPDANAEIDAGFADPEARNPLVWKQVYDEDGNAIPRWVIL